MGIKYKQRKKIKIGQINWINYHHNFFKQYSIGADSALDLEGNNNRAPLLEFTINNIEMLLLKYNGHWNQIS